MTGEDEERAARQAFLDENEQRFKRLRPSRGPGRISIMIDGKNVGYVTGIRRATVSDETKEQNMVGETETEPTPRQEAIATRLSQQLKTPTLRCVDCGDDGAKRRIGTSAALCDNCANERATDEKIKPNEAPDTSPSLCDDDIPF